MHSCLDRHKGQIVGYIHSVAVLAARDQVLDTSAESIEKSLKSYKDIDAWVDNMAMKESSFTRLQDVIELAGELDKRVKFSDIVLTETAQKIYNEVYAK